MFLFMGFGNTAGSFVGLANGQLSFTNPEVLLIALIGFFMFGILSVPKGKYQDRSGKKTVLLIRLIIAFIGLTIPLG